MVIQIVFTIQCIPYQKEIDSGEIEWSKERVVEL